MAERAEFLLCQGGVWPPSYVHATISFATCLLHVLISYRIVHKL